MATGSAADETHPDDVVVWPDGFRATLAEWRGGGFSHRSDDFEIVRHDDCARLRALGVDGDPETLS